MSTRVQTAQRTSLRSSKLASRPLPEIDASISIISVQTKQVRNISGSFGCAREEIPARQLGSNKIGYIFLYSILCYPMFEYLITVCLTDIPIILPSSDQLILDSYLSKGLQPTETELPSDTDSAGSGLPEFDEIAMTQLEGMGFPTVRCQKALLATGNSDPNVAMEWLFEHMEDPDIDDPIRAAVPRGKSTDPEPSQEQIALLADMGFTFVQARKALRETVCLGLQLGTKCV